jgi:hypothetical protein
MVFHSRTQSPDHTLEAVDKIVLAAGVWTEQSKDIPEGDPPGQSARSIRHFHCWIIVIAWADRPPRSADFPSFIFVYFSRISRI